MNKLNCIAPLRRTTWIVVMEGLLSENFIDELRISIFIFHFFFGVSTLTLMIVSMVKAIQTHNSMALNQLVCVFMSAVTVLAKVSAIMNNKRCFISVIDDLKSDTFNTHNEYQNKHIQSVDKITKLILRYYITVGMTFIFFSSALPFILNVKMVIPAPFDVGNYDYLYKIVHFAVISYMVLNSVTFDVLYMSIMGLCIAQLTILKERLINLMKESRKTQLIKEANSLDASESLKECVILHEMLNKFVKKLSTILSLPLFIQYLCGCFIICNTILQLTIAAEITTDVISLISYSSATFSQLVLYHWLGNEITFKSNKIIQACYLSNWYELNSYSQKLLLLLMERAKKPLIMEVYALVNISLDSLGVIIRWSYSLFALLKVKYN